MSDPRHRSRVVAAWACGASVFVAIAVAALWLCLANGVGVAAGALVVGAFAAVLTLASTSVALYLGVTARRDEAARAEREARERAAREVADRLLELYAVWAEYSMSHPEHRTVGPLARIQALLAALPSDYATRLRGFAGDAMAGGGPAVDLFAWCARAVGPDAATAIELASNMAAVQGRPYDVRAAMRAVRRANGATTWTEAQLDWVFDHPGQWPPADI